VSIKGVSGMTIHPPSRMRASLIAAQHKQPGDRSVAAPKPQQLKLDISTIRASVRYPT
jgi:hypothetical protein